MPLIPFVGLSILVHFLIIFYRSFFHTQVGINTSVSAGNFSLARTWLGLFIILGVFSFVLIPAVFLIRLSVFDKHSLVNYIEDRAFVSSNDESINHFGKVISRY